MPRVVVPRSAKQAFISAFSAVSPLLAIDAARRSIRSPRGDRAGWTLMAGIHALPGAYFATGFLRPRRLGIADPNGTPAGMIGYDGDTVLPTLIVTDGEGRIVFADQTDNYRVRPTPETVLAALDGSLLPGNGTNDSSAVTGA